VFWVTSWPVVEGEVKEEGGSGTASADVAAKGAETIPPTRVANTIIASRRGAEPYVMRKQSFSVGLLVLKTWKLGRSYR
jgi:hypothetical protein